MSQKISLGKKFTIQKKKKKKKTYNNVDKMTEQIKASYFLKKYFLFGLAF